MAKSPRAGRSKTRLCPPCTPDQAAELAEAALADTLEVVASSSAIRRVLVLDGPVGSWLPPDFEVLVQRGPGLAERLTAAFEDVFSSVTDPRPTLLVGMDTPQLSAGLIDQALGRLSEPPVDAVLGLADDGGWWSIGLHAPDASVFDGVPMSTSRTGALQRRRLAECGYEVGLLPPMRDVDTWEDALAVANLIPSSRFGCLVAELAG